MLEINKTIEDGKATFALTGRLDTNSAPELQDSLLDNLDGVTDLELDLEGLDYISSAGLRVLLMAQKTMNEQGGMKLTHVSETILDIFEVTCFTDILTIE